MKTINEELSDIFANELYKLLYQLDWKLTTESDSSLYNPMSIHIRELQDQIKSNLGLNQ